MTENAGTSSEDAASARALQQARLRKERREAKIRAGGSARLNKITGLGGGVQRDPGPTPSTPTPAAAAPSPAEKGTTDAHHDDPDDVDISQHFYTPQSTARIPPPIDPSTMSETQLRQMMLGFDPSAGGTGAMGNPFINPNMPGGPGGTESGEEDPMMKLLSQMMAGSGPGAAGGAPPFGGANNPFAQMGVGGPFGPGAAAPGAPQATAPDTYAAVWRLVHFVLAMGLGLYIAFFTTFAGTKIERERAVFESSTAGIPDDDNAVRRYFFYAFATAETVLLTSRMFLDRGRAPPSGMLYTILGFLPEPFRGYLGMGLRYSQIFTTVRSDILVSVFVLGVCSWLRSA